MSVNDKTRKEFNDYIDGLNLTPIYYMDIHTGMCNITIRDYTVVLYKARYNVFKSVLHLPVSVLLFHCFLHVGKCSKIFYFLCQIDSIINYHCNSGNWH